MSLTGPVEVGTWVLGFLGAAREVISDDEARLISDALGGLEPYRRLRPEMYAPVDLNWGVNHRAVAIRIPGSDATNLRFEHRVAGADANPYLVTACVLAGVDHGLRNKLEPPKMVQQGENIQLRTRIPTRWDAALDKFARGKVLHEYLGADYCRHFLTNRRTESQRYHNEISTETRPSIT